MLFRFGAVGDTVTITLTNSGLDLGSGSGTAVSKVYTVAANNTTSTVAYGLARLINADSTFRGLGISAKNSANNLYILHAPATSGTYLAANNTVVTSSVTGGAALTVSPTGGAMAGADFYAVKSYTTTLGVPGRGATSSAASNAGAVIVLW